MLKLMLLMATCFCCFYSFGQSDSRLVSGTITDSVGTKVPGVTVGVKGTSVATVTDDAGKFSIGVPSKRDTLVISYIGYAPQEIFIGRRTNLSITLQASSNKLDEVVVVGYGTSKKRDVTGSISSISADNMTLGGVVANVGQAIQGRAAGVQVQQTNFAPGSTLSIIIRGGNSIQSTNQPLYVVDGFITDNGSQVNPNDIADIQILKDVSAAAIYGSRGANGVVLITTKKGAAGKATIEGNISHGTQYLTYKPDLINGQQYTDVMNAVAAEDGNPPPFPSSFPVTNTNWWNIATQNATVDNQGISVSSGDKNSKLFTSINHLKQTGVLLNTGFKRYTARIGAEKTIASKIKMGGNFYGAFSKSTLQSYTGDITAPLYSIMTAQPNIPVYNADGSYYKYLSKNNALANLIEPTNNSDNRLINANIYLDYDIVKNLTYHIDGGGEFS